VREASWYRRIGSAGGVFALTFVGCVVGLPITGLALGPLLGPVGFGAVAAVMYFPAFALWLGSLRFGPWENARWVHDAEGYHFIPLVVWLVTWAAFGWAARNVGGWRRVGAAVVVIIAVTVGMHLVLAALDIHLVIDVL
jgi:hypothetical protein